LDEPHRIACFHLNQIGDLLFSLPAIHNLRQRYPDAEIISVARPLLKDILRMSRLVDKVIERPDGPFGSALGVISKLRSEHPDLALVFSTSFGMGTIAGLCGAPVRVGFDDYRTNPFLTHRAPRIRPPSLQNNLKLLEAVGCPVVKRDYAGLIHPDETEMEQAEAVLKSVGIDPGETFAVLAPSTSWRREVKCWSDEGFAQVADDLMRQFGVKSIVVGLNNGCRISEMTSNAVDLSGRTSLPVLAAVLGRAAVFIGVDSGVMHLASAMETPVVGLYGPSDPSQTGPQGGPSRALYADLPCRPCLRPTCEDGSKCMEMITPDRVLTAVHSLIPSDVKQVSLA
jgi:ADP-heptose:LPS heptosyltransferase